MKKNMIIILIIMCVGAVWCIENDYLVMAVSILIASSVGIVRLAQIQDEIDRKKAKEETARKLRDMNNK